MRLVIHRYFIEEYEVHVIHENLAPAVALIPIGFRTLKNDFVDYLGQMFGGEKTDLFAELEFLVISDVFSLLFEQRWPSVLRLLLDF